MSDNYGGLTGFFQLLGALGTSLGTSMNGSTGSGNALTQLAESLGIDPTSITPYSDLEKNGPKSAKSDPLVWMGARIKPTPQRMPMTPNQLTQYAAMSEKHKANGAGGRNAVTLSAAQGLPFTWNEKQRAEAYKRVGDSIGRPITSFEQFIGVWETAAITAGKSWAATDGGKKGSPLTIWDVFDLAKRDGSKYGYGDGSGGAGGTTISKSTSVEKLSDGSVWSILKQAATQSLGRAPTTDELQRFASKANQVASANPTMSTTRTTTSAGGSTSHTTTQQGASAGDYQLAAENQANANPEAGAYQAASTYFNALIQGMESVV